MRPPLWVTAILLNSVVLSCFGESGSDAETLVQRDTLENGVVHLRYFGLPPERVYTIDSELQLGAEEGDPNLVFGDVRGIDAGEDGRIYVLDHLASEIRAFDSSGTFLHQVATQGEGPGEIGGANGIILVGDTILWVQDPSKWTMIGLSPDGKELARVTMPVLSYSYLWNGTVDNAGRIWKPDSHTDREGPEVRREGLNEGTARLYWKSLDPSNNAVDSVYLGDHAWRVFRSRMGNGWLHSGIPFDPEILTAVDPDGGFWQSHNATYRVARLEADGDTTLVLEVDVEPILVEPDEQRAYIDQSAERGPRFRAVAEEVAELMPETKPAVQRLIQDDEGRVWVKRTVKEGADPLYDVFSRNGEYQGSVEFEFHPDRFRPIRIRHGHIYAVVVDDWDVPSVVRAEVPREIGERARF